MATGQLVYVSEAVSPVTDAVLTQIGKTGQANNTPLGITGLLIHSQNSFVQILEGELFTIVDRFDHLRHDPRHNNVSIVMIEPAASRMFKDKSLAILSLSSAPPEERVRVQGLVARWRKAIDLGERPDPNEPLALFRHARGLLTSLGEFKAA